MGLNIKYWNSSDHVMGHISTDQLETSLPNLGLLKTEHPPRAGVRLDIIPVISCLVYEWMVKK